LFAKTKRARLNLPNQGTGIPYDNKQAHARVVSIMLILSSLKITSFWFEIQSEMLLIFYF